MDIILVTIYGKRNSRLWIKLFKLKKKSNGQELKKDVSNKSYCTFIVLEYT